MLLFSLALSGMATAAPLEAEKLMQDANVAYKAGSYNLAGKLFNKAIIAAPELSAAYFGSAKAWLEMGDCRQAINDLDECIRLNPGDVESYCIRSYAWQVLGDYDKAVADINVALAVQPKNSALYYARGLIHVNQGEIGKAVADYDTAIAFIADTPKKLRADSLQVFAELAEVAPLDKNGGAVYFQRGMAYSQNGDFKAAKKDFKRAVKIKPELGKEIPECT